MLIRKSVQVCPPRGTVSHGDFLAWAFLFLFILGFNIFSAKEVLAGKPFAGGYYTNLCGRGTTADYIASPPCSTECNPDSGYCANDGSGATVFKYVCNGNLTQCLSGEQQSYGTSVNSPDPGKGKTVQVDVFNKDCRAGGGWSCSNSDLKTYMVWYSGDATTPPDPGGGNTYKCSGSSCVYCGQSVAECGGGVTYAEGSCSNACTPSGANTYKCSGSSCVYCGQSVAECGGG